MGLSIVGGILAFQIFSAATKTQLTPEQIEIIKPIDGTVNEKVINNLDKRTFVTQAEIDGLVTAPQVTVSPTAPLLATESAPITTPQ
ncbi:hypothetical protein A3K29_01400 [Candidatus Collierbacteria bacterium RIFOXYB2_FULL_46_14]|nr:MAG: hypothetical protein A3K29_01400 [Candidatus Collierbacteria bacterium RIFOXYB2_FULL_46_14]OGD75827.1 MAG: hypothetical protein A3K43_01400 [Candidatus Collierbacteria bacterium RIFOXYA2_FULL_46_20]OGD77163.1 MAG: hypothetical protein A3K39_01400 [Candidatus Collierbacteria bacterium RIFOXYC2_FULL_43_15]OGD80453.1 MAG: hypothetical protein A2320_01890 [Pseudomonadales bacterium GWC2_63_15]OGD81885.1 MAG: hypothetical protein A3K36_01400 [Candidatus Collierbacteria bacterium RIFOXYD2_FUL